MIRKTSGLLGCVALLAAASIGCGSSAAPPFDTLPNSNLTAFRLQNYEPPQQQASTTGQTPATGALPGVPPEIMQWVQQGAAGLQQFIPPGLIPPNLLPPGAATAAVPAAVPQEQVPRFPNRADGFRILSQTPVIDEGLKEELGDLLGDEDNFYDQHASCMYAELGLSFTSTAGGPNNDVLVSFSCNQVAAAGGFAWPHPSVGMKPDMVGKLADLANRLFPPGT
jgi:hypothetical protein